MNRHYTHINNKLKDLAERMDKAIGDLEQIKERVGLNDKITVINVQGSKDGLILRVEVPGNWTGTQIDKELNRFGPDIKWWR